MLTAATHHPGAAAFPGHALPNRKAPRGGRLSTGRGPKPWHLGLDRVGCLGFTHDLSGAWQGRKEDHVWEKRCSELDLLGCDPGSGYAALRFNMRESEVAYRSLLLRDDARATSPSSPVVCRIVGAPPLCAPARVIPGRTLLGVKVGSAPIPSLNFKLDRMDVSGGCAEVPVSVLLQRCIESDN